MIQQLQHKQIKITNANCANLYIDSNTKLEVVECCIDWDVVDYSDKKLPVLNGVKVVVKRHELAPAIRVNDELTHNIIQSEEIETLDFSPNGDWVTNLEKLEQRISFDDAVIVKGVEVNFKQLVVFID